MRPIAIFLLGAAVSVAPAQRARAETPKTAAAQDSAAAEKEAADLMGAVDWQRFSAEPELARQTREKLEQLRASASTPSVVFGIDAIRHIALLVEGKNLESLHLAQELLAQEPDAAGIYATALWAAVYANEPTAAVALLEKAARHVNNAEGLAQLRPQLPSDLVWSIFQQLNEKKDKNGQARAAEALLILGGTDREAMPWLEGVRGIALDGRVDAGKLEQARKLARTLVDPRQVVRLAGARRYDPLFPGREDRQPTVEAAIAANDGFTASWLKNHPKEAKAILARGQHLRSVGKAEEALAVLLPGAIERTRSEPRDETAFWIVNEAAYALSGLGRHAEALALMEKLLELPLAENPSLVSMAINHGAILLSAGRFAEAVAWDNALEGKAKGFANDYGFMWIWSTAACAESLAGNSSAAAPWLAKLAASSDKNKAAHTRALLCANDLDAAEAMLVKRLDGDDAADLLVGLHDYQLDTVGNDADRTISERLRAVIERPRMKAAIEAMGHRLSLPLSKIYWGDT
jgi:tetratricopeptide (TPR) repeat protein